MKKLAFIAILTGLAYTGSAQDLPDLVGKLQATLSKVETAFVTKDVATSQQGSMAVGVGRPGVPVGLPSWAAD